MDILGNVIARPKCMFILNLDITKWIQMSPNSICEFMCVCVCLCPHTHVHVRVCTIVHIPVGIKPRSSYLQGMHFTY